MADLDMTKQGGAINKNNSDGAALVTGLVVGAGAVVAGVIALNDERNKNKVEKVLNDAEGKVEEGVKKVEDAVGDKKVEVKKVVADKKVAVEKAVKEVKKGMYGRTN